MIEAATEKGKAGMGLSTKNMVICEKRTSLKKVGFEIVCDGGDAAMGALPPGRSCGWRCFPVPFQPRKSNFPKTNRIAAVMLMPRTQAWIVKGHDLPWPTGLFIMVSAAFCVPAR